MWDCESRPTSGTVLSILLLPLIAAGLLPAQTPIRGSVHPQVQRDADLGPVSEETVLPALRISFNPAGEQELALDKMIAEQRNPGSPSYHQWLTPEQFGTRFGISMANETLMRQWLKSQGFKNVVLSRSRTAVTFTGTVEQVRTAFHTEIHSLSIGGEQHYANVGEIKIPDNLSSLVRNVSGLDDFRLQSRAHRVKPAFTGLLGSSVVHGLAPGDIATIYDINSLYAAGIDGSGMNVAVVGQSDIDLNDVAEYRSGYGLPDSTPTVITYLGDPGVVSASKEEGELDVEILGAVAPKAQITFVTSPSVMNALFYAIEQNVAPVVSMSFGYCERGDTPSDQQDIQFATMQANAEGMTLLVASGDQGAADCDLQSIPEGGAMNGAAIDSPSNQPGFTSVGGTSFSVGNGSYFASANGATGGSAISYIPEKAWNDTTSTNLLATGGGASIYYTKPGWQEGIGVPNDGARDVPDVSMFSLNEQEDGTQFGYLTCTDNMCASGINPGDQWGGTSAAAPVFAGIITLLNEYLVSNNIIQRPGLGNVNPQLYLLAWNAAASFHDITLGNNDVPCKLGSLDCTTGNLGFSAGPGYDQATGIGSPDAANLVHSWSSVTVTPTHTNLSSSPAPIINNGTQLTLTAMVTASGAIPNGNVTFYAIAGLIPLGMLNSCLSVLGTAPLDATGTATLNLPTGLTYNVFEVYAAYSGTTLFTESFSESLSAHQPGPQVTLSSSPNQIDQGGSVTLTANVYEFSNQVGTVTFFSGDTPLGTVAPTPVPDQTADWTASISTTALSAGQDSITAFYAGDEYFAATTSPSITISVIPSNLIPTGITLIASPASGQVGDSITLTVTATSALGSMAPTGTVAFFNCAIEIGAATLNNGVASIQVTSLPVGTDSLTATYQGAADFRGSTSQVVYETIADAADAISSISNISPAFAKAGASSFPITVSGTAFVSGSTIYWGNTALPTTFVSGTELTGSVQATGVSTAGIVAITVQSPTPGDGTSGAFQFEIDSASTYDGAPTFTTSSATVTAGNTATYLVVLPFASLGVTATCLNLPVGASCSYAAAANTLTITTRPTSPVGIYNVTVVFTETVAGTSAFFTLLPFLLVARCWQRKKAIRNKVWSAVLVVVFIETAILATTGCGAGSPVRTFTIQPQQEETISNIVSLIIR